MIIGIIGSRKRDTDEDFNLVEDVFLQTYKQDDTLVSGGCPKGGDRFAEIIAKKYCIPIKIHYANWSLFGPRAGFQRNSLIASDADILIACISSDRTGGTEDTIRKFSKKKTLILV